MWEYYAAGIIIGVLIMVVFCRKCDRGAGRRHPNNNNNSNMQTNVAMFPVTTTTGGQNDYVVGHPLMDSIASDANHSSGLQAEMEDMERKEERRFRILTGIIHKKVVANVLPHENELSIRSAKGIDDVMQDQQNDHNKQDIHIDALVSFRSSRSTRGLLDSTTTNNTTTTTTTTIYSPKECPICLEKYKENDEICWSKNENCCHAFHLNCMMEWLMENDECPLCRSEYLISSFDV